MSNRIVHVSKRQGEVLALLKLGRSKAQIAAELQISFSVVKDHVQRLSALKLTWFNGAKRVFSEKTPVVVDDIPLSISYGCKALLVGNKTNEENNIRTDQRCDDSGSET